ncbi:MraY family glycosyltransferase [Teredinibacter sp. KSP-S5-2]|uniref:glycosyltransferase family 4 protein n=1 Tax=Teredinibacter sp. KSP-S5-2 TaxID=3034506 RepID=UPI0029349C18|nr:MraY family glycosyltransferase [Teredinibacter sp. KSP-S5-2]WNO10645.1 MraY family glycosyltransferase [Teredinibacter sp. KSP-S5-2]
MNEGMNSITPILLYSVALLLSFFVTLVLVPQAKKIAEYVGAIDTPNHRRVNTECVPSMGGVAMFAGFIISLLAVAVFSLKFDLFKLDYVRELSVLIVGCLAIVGLGVIDDSIGVKAHLKLMIHLGIGLYTACMGLKVDSIYIPFMQEVQLGVFSIPITVLWIVLVVNAINFIDGLDGLAAGIVFLTSLFIIYYGVKNGHFLLGLVYSGLLGSLIGFLFFNFNPAKLFMGDSGAFFLGYIIATGALVQEGGTVETNIWVPVLALGLPILDFLTAVARRILNKSYFVPDKDHIHHKLLKKGLSHKTVVLFMYCISVIFGMAALIVSNGKAYEVFPTIAFLGCFVLIFLNMLDIFKKT